MEEQQRPPQHHVPRAEFMEMTGMILARQHRTYRPSGEPEHVWQVFKKVQIHNLLLGWWSVYALFINPIILVANTLSWFQFKRDYNQYVYNPQDFQTRQERIEHNRQTRPKRFLKWVIIFTVGFLVLMFALLFLSEAMSNS